MVCECCNEEKARHEFSESVCEDCCNSLILGQPNRVENFIIDYDMQKEINKSNGVDINE